MYKSLGIAAQDLAAAYHVFERAAAAGVGQVIDW
jgi:ornithine cyclodeaminase/alanine dehydrogenase-like protein (mu-crystallin family)